MKFIFNTKKLGTTNGIIIEDSDMDFVYEKAKKHVIQSNPTLLEDKDIDKYIHDNLEVEDDDGKIMRAEDYFNQGIYGRWNSTPIDESDFIDPESEEGKRILEEARLERLKREQ